MVIEVKWSLEFTRTDLREIATKCNCQQDLCSRFNKAIELVNQTKVAAHEDKVDYIENQSRRNNLYFSGIPEDHRESCSDTESKVAAIMKKQKHISENLAIERAHRVGSVKRSDKS